MSLAHPSLATFEPLTTHMTRAIRRRRLARHCLHLGATVPQVTACRDTADLWQLRTTLLELLMQPGDEAA